MNDLLGAPGPRFDSGPGLILGSWIMMKHVSCILLLEWSTTSQRLWVYRISVPYAEKDPWFLFEKKRGQNIVHYLEKFIFLQK